jgi:hypothetical protein
MLGLDVDRCSVEGGRVLFAPDGRLSLTAHARGLEVALELGSRDLAGARTRVADAGAKVELVAALEAMPEQFELRTYDGRHATPARATMQEVGALLASSGGEPGAIWLGWTIPRDVALEHAATLDEQLEDAMVLLGGLLARVLGLSAPLVAGGPAPRLKRNRGLAAPSRPSAGRKAGGAIEKGARVRVLEGPFAGKVGTVRELDGKGGARVMMGLLAVCIDVKNLAGAEGRARPVLASSHRKPVPVRS